MATNDYDSTASTLKHIRKVQRLLGDVANKLVFRGISHDISKLSEPEKVLFDKYSPEAPSQKGLVYQSEQYEQNLKELKVALDHHYEHNTHHPEYYEKGVNGMDLLDIVEMLCDWIATTDRYKGNILEAIEINANRFEIDDQLKTILRNTVINLDGGQKNK